ncbi:hypothetical protein Pelo_8849 [Pelomyxa schiedti]|nr:hypothetical protein Pelo_8849 [Pelomyxa schiedti]
MGDIGGASFDPRSLSTITLGLAHRKKTDTAPRNDSAPSHIVAGPMGGQPAAPAEMTPAECKKIIARTMYRRKIGSLVWCLVACWLTAYFGLIVTRLFPLGRTLSWFHTQVYIVMFAAAAVLLLFAHHTSSIVRRPYRTSAWSVFNDLRTNKKLIFAYCGGTTLSFSALYWCFNGFEWVLEQCLPEEFQCANVKFLTVTTTGFFVGLGLAIRIITKEQQILKFPTFNTSALSTLRRRALGTLLESLVISSSTFVVGVFVFLIIGWNRYTFTHILSGFIPFERGVSDMPEGKLVFLFHLGLVSLVVVTCWKFVWLANELHSTRHNSFTGTKRAPCSLLLYAMSRHEDEAPFIKYHGFQDFMRVCQYDSQRRAAFFANNIDLKKAVKLCCESIAALTKNLNAAVFFQSRDSVVKIPLSHLARQCKTMSAISPPPCDDPTLSTLNAFSSIQIQIFAIRGLTAIANVAPSEDKLGIMSTHYLVTLILIHFLDCYNALRLFTEAYLNPIKYFGRLPTASSVLSSEVRVVQEELHRSLYALINTYRTTLDDLKFPPEYIPAVQSVANMQCT